MIKTVLDKGAFVPKRAYKKDTGLDVRTPVEFDLPNMSQFIVDTGVHVEVPDGCTCFVKDKSGLWTNYGIMTTGVVDIGYTGSIRIKLVRVDFGHRQNEVLHFNIGDKIAQLEFHPILLDDCVLVDELDATERSNNGFGSTGR